MKTKIILAILLLVNLSLAAQSSAIFIQNLSVPENQPLVIELPQSYTIQAYAGTVMKVEATVTLQNGGLGTLHYLNQRGQYKLQLQQRIVGVQLSDNSVRKRAMINSAPLCEVVKYTIYVPESIAVLDMEQTTQLLANR